MNRTENAIPHFANAKTIYAMVITLTANSLKIHRTERRNRT